MPPHIIFVLEPPLLLFTNNGCIKTLTQRGLNATDNAAMEQTPLFNSQIFVRIRLLSYHSVSSSPGSIWYSAHLSTAADERAVGEMQPPPTTEMRTAIRLQRQGTWARTGNRVAKATGKMPLDELDERACVPALMASVYDDDDDDDDDEDDTDDEETPENVRRGDVAWEEQEMKRMVMMMMTMTSNKLSGRGTEDADGVGAIMLMTLAKCLHKTVAPSSPDAYIVVSGTYDSTWCSGKSHPQIASNQSRHVVSATRGVSLSS